jgi:Lipopolysaccharide-assembly/Camelysin metallo-endopeptidase
MTLMSDNSHGVNIKQDSKPVSPIFRVCFLAISGLVLLSALFFNTGCSFSYRFNDISFPDSIKTVKINFIENKATYVNPQLSPRLTDKLRQKIISQTKLTQTNNDNADWVINGAITNYSFSTSGISQNQVASNRLTVAVHIILNDQKQNETKEYDVSRNFEFSANKSIQEAEAGLTDDIIRGLTDDIFNRMFSTW